MISKTKIKTRTRQKSNSDLQDTIRLALKNKAWFKIAQILSNSTRKYSSVNLGQIDKVSKQGEIIVVPGKVLSSGSLTKKVRIASLGISAEAKDKLKETKSEYVYLAKEIQSNTKAEGIRLIQ
jgi:large subunit ribosomal protein L18e